MATRHLADRQYALVDGHRISYYRKGEGTPLVLIHGITTYSFLWQEMFPLLAADYDVVALDLMGCGDSDKPLDADFSIQAQARMITSLMNQIGIERAHFLTHDIGGGVGQILAVAEPGRMLSLSMINTVGYDFWPVQPIVTLRVPALRHMAMAALDIGMLKVLVTRGFFHKDKVTDDLLSQYRRPLMTYEGRQGFLNLAKHLDNRNLMDISDRFSKIAMPVLIIWGNADAYLTPMIADRLMEDIPGAERLDIPTAGHYGPLDEPEIMAGAVIKFLAAANSKAVI